MPSQRPSASRSRKILFNMKTIQYAGSLNCVPFQKVEGKAGPPLPCKRAPLHGRNGILTVRAPHTRQGRNRAARSDLDMVGTPHTRQGLALFGLVRVVRIWSSPHAARARPAQEPPAAFGSPLPTCQRHTGCLGAILPYLPRLLTCQGRAGTCGRKAQSLPHSVPRAHKATPVHGKPPPLWVQGPKTGEKKGGKPGKRARPPTVSRLYTTDGVFFSPCTERSVLQCS